jgi:hypothetical protein
MNASEQFGPPVKENAGGSFEKRREWNWQELTSLQQVSASLNSTAQQGLHGAVWNQPILPVAGMEALRAAGVDI